GHSQCARCRSRARTGRLPHHQYQGRARGRLQRSHQSPQRRAESRRAGMVRGMLEAGIGRAQNIALSTLPNFSLPGDVSASQRYWKEDIIEPEVTVSGDGYITVPQTAGTGFHVRADLIEKLTVRKEEIRSGGASA